MEQTKHVYLDRDQTQREFDDVVEAHRDTLLWFDHYYKYSFWFLSEGGRTKAKVGGIPQDIYTTRVDSTMSITPLWGINELWLKRDGTWVQVAEDPF